MHMESSLAYSCPEFLYASRKFECFFRQVLNEIDRKHQAFFHQKRIELVEEIESLKRTVARANSAKSYSRWLITEENHRDARVQRLKKEFSVFSEQLYASASAVLRSEAIAVRTEALNHFHQRHKGDEYAAQELSTALDRMLIISEPSQNAAELFKCPLYHEGFCRLNPIDLTK